MEVKDKLNRQYSIRPAEDGIKVLDVDDTSRTVTGVYNTMLYFDHDRDVIMPGSFTKSLNERGVNSTGKAKIKHAMFHDMTRLPFKPILIEERTIDGKQMMYFESKAGNTTEGNDALENYKMGIYDNHSFGFQYVQGKLAMFERDTDEYKELMSMVINPDDMAKSDYVFKVTEVNQFEFSTVGIGANELTPFLGMKSIEQLPVIQKQIEDRINKIQYAVKAGNFTDETFYVMEVQLKQLKQIMFDLTILQPATKDTVIIQQPDEVTEVPEFDIEKFKSILSKNLN
jgi:hypothetical protein